MSTIDQIPAPSIESLDEPLTTGVLLKIFAEVIKPVKLRLDDHERRIEALEEKSISSSTKIDQVGKDGKDLKNKMTVAETKIRHLEASQEKLKTIAIKQQRKIATQDKSNRLKNLVLAGISENAPLQEADTDMQKVMLILKALDLDYVDVISCRRTGNKDQGPENRPRFLIVEFLKQHQRNKVKLAAPKLKEIPYLKDIRIKADLTKEERDEYKRIYDLRDQLEIDNPGKEVTVDKGSVIMDGNVMDKFKTPTTDF